VQQAVLARNDLDDGAEVQQPQDSAVVGLAHFDRRGQFSDAALGCPAGGGVDRSDGHDAFVGDVDLGAGFFGQSTDDGAALADHVADLFRVDADGDQGVAKSDSCEFTFGMAFCSLPVR